MIILKNVFSRELEVGFFREIFGEIPDEGISPSPGDSNTSHNRNEKKDNDIPSDTIKEGKSDDDQLNNKIQKYIDNEFIEDKKC